MVELRSNVRRMLANHDSIKVIGEAGDGEEALRLAQEFSPHVILMDINMPKLDGLKATEALTKSFPNVQVVMMSIQSEQEYFRRAMKAGAKDYLTKPFSSSDLVDTITNVFNRWIKDRPEFAFNEPKAQVLTFFSTKGGVGKTTLAVNLAISLAGQGKRVLLIDASLQFGDVGITLNQKAHKNIYNIVQNNEEITTALVEQNFSKHPSGLLLLLAPVEPAFADAIKTEHLNGIIEAIAGSFQFIIVDTATSIGPIELAILDRTDLVLLVATLEISSLKNTKLCLKTLSDISFDLKKVKLVLNKDIPNVGIGGKDIEEGLGIPLYATVPMDSETAQRALNLGEPFVQKCPETTIAQAIQRMAENIIGTEDPAPSTSKSAFFRIKDILFGTK